MCLEKDPKTLSPAEWQAKNFFFPNAESSPVVAQMRSIYRAQNNTTPLLNFGGQRAPGSVPQYDQSKKPTTFFEAKPVQPASPGGPQAQPGQSPATAPIASLFDPTKNTSSKLAGGIAGTMKIVP